MAAERGMPMCSERPLFYRVSQGQPHSPPRVPQTPGTVPLPPFSRDELWTQCCLLDLKPGSQFDYNSADTRSLKDFQAAPAR